MTAADTIDTSHLSSPKEAHKFQQRARRIHGNCVMDLPTGEELASRWGLTITDARQIVRSIRCGQGVASVARVLALRPVRREYVVGGRSPVTFAKFLKSADRVYRETFPAMSVVGDSHHADHGDELVKVCHKGNRDDMAAVTVFSEKRVGPREPEYGVRLTVGSLEDILARARAEGAQEVHLTGFTAESALWATSGGLTWTDQELVFGEGSGWAFTLDVESGTLRIS